MKITEIKQSENRNISLCLYCLYYIINYHFIWDQPKNFEEPLSEHCI